MMQRFITWRLHGQRIVALPPESLFNRLKYVDTLQSHSLKGVSRGTTLPGTYFSIDNNMATNQRVIVMILTAGRNRATFPNWVQL